MNRFDNLEQDYEHKFINRNAGMLEQMFGSGDLAPLWVADIDFPVAEAITKELQRLVDRSVFSYEFDAKRIYRAISEWNATRHGLSRRLIRFFRYLEC